VGALVLLPYWLGPPAPPSPPIVRGVDLDRLERAVRAYPEVHIGHPPGKPFVVSGFVTSATEKASLRQTVQSMAPQVELQVRTADELRAQAQQLIGDPEVSLHYQGRGRLLAQGQVSNSQLSERIRQINADWQPHAFIQDQLEIQKKVTSKKTDAESVAFWQKQLPSRLVSINQSGNGLPYIQLDNHHLYFEGSVLKSGAEIKKIEPNALDLRPMERGE
jgi:hypothetical protein